MTYFYVFILSNLDLWPSSISIQHLDNQAAASYDAAAHL